MSFDCAVTGGKPESESCKCWPCRHNREAGVKQMAADAIATYPGGLTMIGVDPAKTGDEQVVFRPRNATEVLEHQRQDGVFPEQLTLDHIREAIKAIEANDIPQPFAPISVCPRRIPAEPDPDEEIADLVLSVAMFSLGELTAEELLYAVADLQPELWESCDGVLPKTEEEKARDAESQAIGNAFKFAP